MKTRAVIFMTAQRAADIPHTDNPLACLLPFGSATFAERVMDSCATAGLRHVDVVVSECPEAVRALLGDGSAWGLTLTWHLAKDSATPYKVLHSLDFADDDLVIVGHAHQWVADRVVRALQQDPGMAMHIGQSVRWAGWYSDTARQVCMLDTHEDGVAMGKRVSAMARPCVLARFGEFAQAGSASELLQAQELAFDRSVVDSVPASWRPMPWGAISPDATVSADATIVGPVLIGPGCVVDGAAQVGPKVVLSRNVFVADGAEIRQSVVLSNTYVDGRVTLEQAVVQGNSVQNLKWDVRTVLAPEDAMLTPLVDIHANRTPLASRILAVLVAMLLAPCVVLLAGWQWLTGKPVWWRRTPVVKLRNFETGALQTVTIRQAHPGGWPASGVGLYGAVLDIVQGRRRWFGLRPRNTSEWYALGRDWQILFSQSMLGVFHAPSWSEDPQGPDNESVAAADAFMAVRPTLRDRFDLIRQGVQF